MTRRAIVGTVLLGLCAALVVTPAYALEGERVSVSEKGSLLVFTKVEIRWDAAGNLIQDTFIDISNDYPGYVAVQMYFVNGDAPLPATANDREHLGYNWVDNQIVLTANQPVYWAASNGAPQGVSPFPMLDPSADPLLQGRPANDGSGERMMRGFVLAWAVDPVDGEEICWNHLKGDAMIVNYQYSAAWEYGAWAFGAVEGFNLGDPLLSPYGKLELDGSEYEMCFDYLLLDFYATGTTAFSGADKIVGTDTDLTLLPMKIDLRQETEGPYTTKAKFDIWNMNEVKFSNTERCITHWDQELIGNYDAPNHFLLTNLQTNKGKARIDGMASEVVCGSDSIDVALLGVAAKILDFEGMDTAFAGTNLIGMGTQSGKIKVDLLSPPPEAPQVTAPTLQRSPVKPVKGIR